MSIYVFTGPTLSFEEGRIELEAVYLPPVAQGDVHRIGLQRPWAIGIIDGYFDRVPAVWHKEILWAMAQGIHVYGAASMGALRAAELAPFGMVGVGKVFEAFRDGVLEDDDEVAVVHAPAGHGFRPASEAMVNIRVTLSHAEQSNVISRETRLLLESAAKALYYPDRSYQRLLAEAARVPAEEISALRAWLPGGRIDQKRADALTMLRTLRRHAGENREPKGVSFVVEHTKFWDRAMQSAGVAEARDEVGDQARIEMISSASVLDELRLDPPTYGRVRQEVLLHHLLVSEARRRGYAVSPDAERQAARDFSNEHGLYTQEELDAWLAANHLTAERFSALLREQILVRMVLPRLRDEASHRLLDQLRMGGHYRRLVSRAADKQRTLEEAGPLPAAPDSGPGDEFLLEWFLNRVGPADEKSVEGQAAVLEYAHQNPSTFLDALAREYRYLVLSRAKV